MQHYIDTYVALSKKFADVITETTCNNRGNLFLKKKRQTLSNYFQLWGAYGIYSENITQVKLFSLW